MPSKSTTNWHIKITAIIALILCASIAHAIIKIPDAYQKAKTVQQAVEAAQAKLITDSKDEYIGLLTEKRVRDAIPIAIKSHEAKLDEIERKYPGTKAYFETVIKPAIAKIAASGEWQANCWFDITYGLVDQNGVRYDGLLVRLTVETPDAQFKGFALPIVDLYFGRVP